MNICDIREASRPGEGGAADKSISFSFTSTGKALGARGNVPVAAVATAAGAKQGGVPAKLDLLTLDDVSEGEQSEGSEKSKPSAGAFATGSLHAGAGTGVGAGRAAVGESVTAKSVDPGLRTIISDMVAAIEVAVWDAAMRH